MTSIPTYWWTVEIAQFVLLISVPLFILRLIRRHGRQYVDELFANSPAAGPAILRLLDVAYYLIFISYALFFISLEPPFGSTGAATTFQLQETIASVAGITLILGLLHGVNVLVLPLLARTSTRRAPPSETSADSTPQTERTQPTAKPT